MKKKYIALVLIATIIFYFLCACEYEKKDDTSLDYITAAIDKINDSNRISIHFKSESTMESNHITHSILDSYVTFVKEPYTRYYESVNSYFENDKQIYKIIYGSYITTKNGDIKQYEKSQGTANESHIWKPSVVDDDGLKDLSNYYTKEFESYLYMFSANKNTFKKGHEEYLDGKAVIKYEGYFTKETAKECIVKYLEDSFLLFGSDFADVYLFTKISNSPDKTPVSIWFDKENGNPILIHINMTDTDQFYMNKVGENLPSTSTWQTYKVKESYIKIDIESIDDNNWIPLPEEIIEE